MPPSKHRSTGRRSRTSRRYTPPINTGVDRNRTRRWLFLGAAIAIAVLVIGSLVVGSIPGGGFAGLFSGHQGEYVDGVGEEVELHDDRAHMVRGTPIEALVEGGYISDPPTSGRHWPYWADCGFYRGTAIGQEPLENEVIVHNMEHGNIILSYNIADPSTVDELEALWTSIPEAADWGIARWYDGIAENEIALTTWGIIDRWNIDENPNRLDRERIVKFFDAYKGVMGPEFPNGSPCRGTGQMSPGQTSPES